MFKTHAAKELTGCRSGFAGGLRRELWGAEGAIRIGSGQSTALLPLNHSKKANARPKNTASHHIVTQQATPALHRLMLLAGKVGCDNTRRAQESSHLLAGGLATSALASGLLRAGHGCWGLEM